MLITERVGSCYTLGDLCLSPFIHVYISWRDLTASLNGKKFCHDKKLLEKFSGTILFNFPPTEVFY